MQRRIPMIVLSTVSLNSTIANRTCSVMAASILAATLVLGGCGPALTRPQVSQEDLLKQRTTADEQFAATSRKILGRLLARTKAKYARSDAAGKQRPVIDSLIGSGGGDCGSVGAAS